MIISVSRRTDIPAFFSDWFLRRVEQGYFCAKNPFNPSQVQRVSLEPGDVDAFVFFSKDPRPLMRHLARLDASGFHYYFQFTLNAYDATLEPSVPPLEQRIRAFQELGATLGPSRVVWRYDPVIISSGTGREYHVRSLASIARRLEGYTERLIISFLDFYPRVRVRLERLEAQGLTFADIAAPCNADTLYHLASEISAIGSRHGMRVQTCCEKVDLDLMGIEHGSCIDSALIERLFGAVPGIPRDRNQRPGCLCAQSVDMGAYNTCSHGCVYCYANSSAASKKANLARHRPDSPFLVG